MPERKSLGLRVWPLLWTRYHRQLAALAWRSALARFIERRLDGKLPAGAWGIACVVRSAYSAERHMGPHSAVKHHFEVVCGWWRGWRLWERESYQASVRYVPASGEFHLRSEEWRLRELLLVNASRKQAVDEMLDRILAGCPSSELESFLCPICAAPMSVRFEPENELGELGFVLWCSKDERHVHRSALMNSPPD